MEVIEKKVKINAAMDPSGSPRFFNITSARLLPLRAYKMHVIRTRAHPYNLCYLERTGLHGVAHECRGCIGKSERPKAKSAREKEIWTRAEKWPGRNKNDNETKREERLAGRKKGHLQRGHWRDEEGKRFRRHARDRKRQKRDSGRSTNGVGQ